jgi:hypothetical protein
LIQKGEWLNNELNGLGEEILKDEYHYLGLFKNGTKNGQGKMIFQNGDQYEGDF